ncbi:hypothetical protein NKH33_31395 [Mesorhizobium sp. M1182]|uniref:hypothetical protein n=1 Tax=Mesorhizobium sp. M1182 TaxID=2957067 RepID=UPI0033384935
MRTADTDIFNLVSLRGSTGSAPVDPVPGASGSIVTPILKTANLDLRSPNPQVLSSLPAGVALSAKTMTGLKLEKLAKAIDKPKSVLVSTLAAFQTANRDVDAKAVGSEYTQLLDTWLIARISKDNPLAGQAERLIKAGRLWNQFLADPGPLKAPGVIADLLEAKLVFPQYLLNAANKAQAPSTSASPTIATDKRKFAEIKQDVAIRESIKTKANQLYYENLANSSAQRVKRPPANANTRSAFSNGQSRAARLPPLLDNAFFKELDNRLTATEKQILGGWAGGTGLGARKLGLGTFFGSVLDVDGLLVEANDLCAKIKVFESEQATTLPSPSAAPVGNERPAVRAIGWGDLIVARERLVGYEAREIAHIENVMPGEEKTRKHELKQTTEQVTETTTLTEQTREKDLQTTDRHELQTQVNTVIDEKFSIKAGVNLSGRYGVTTVNTSLDTAFDRNKSESRSATSQVAQEIISKTVDKTFESVRELRRTTITEAVREFNLHSLKNLAASGSNTPPKAISGVFCWVEKIHEVGLRHYGTRLMVEFHIPEPGLSLFSQAQATRISVPKPAPLALGPLDIHPTNYLCIAKSYGAVGVEPPPAQFIDVGYTWRSEPSEDEDGGESEDTIAAMIAIPDGYQPISGHASLTSIPLTSVSTDQIYLYVAIGGREVIESIGYSKDADWMIERAAQWPNGVPVSMMAHGHWDKTLTLHATLRCERTAQAMTSWQLRTWEKVVDAHERLQQQYDRAVLEAAAQNAALFEISGASEAVNREVERNELKKWAIKTMRVETFDGPLFDAIVNVSDQPEIDPVVSDRQKPIVSFFEEAFEWREMSYFLYPYFWGRRSAWNARLATTGTDFRHTAFLQAGAARVIVPITPGYEERVLHYLDSDPAEPEVERIASPAPGEVPADSQNPQLWLDLIVEKNADLALGSGTLSVAKANDLVTINSDSRWTPSDRDLGRDVFIGGDRYQVIEAIPVQQQIRLDRPYEQVTDTGAAYATGSVPYGAPWLVRIPTELVILKENIGLLAIP